MLGRFVVLMLGSMFLLGSFSVTQAEVVFEYRSDGERILQVIGRSGEVTYALRPSRNASGAWGLTGFKLGEVGDRPCDFDIWSWPLERTRATNGNRYAGANKCRGGNTVSNAGSIRRVALETGAFVTGVQLCLNRNRTRVKGIRVVGRELDWSERGITHSGLWTGAPVQNSFKRTNCKHWTDWSRCSGADSGSEIAVGVIAHFNEVASNRSASLGGIQLICKLIDKRVD